jgi:hypothetical protein
MYTIYITEVALDATCVTGEPATQCADSLATCRDESGVKCCSLQYFNTRKRIYHGLVICNHVIVEDNLRQAVQDKNCYKLNSLKIFISFFQQFQIQKQDINWGHLLNIRFLKNNLKIPKSNRNRFRRIGNIKSKTMGSRNCLPFQSIWFNSRFSWVFLVVFCLQLFVFSPFSFWFLYCLSVEYRFRLPFGIFKLFWGKRIFKRWPLLIPYFCISNCWKNEINISKLLSL